jgi:hypothetical protein
MVASKKYLSKALWLALVESQSSYDNCIAKYGKDYHGPMMSEVLSKIEVPSYPSAEHVAYWS